MNRLTTTAALLALLLCAVAAAQSIPSPTLAFKVNPNISRKWDFSPICPPNVVSTSIAFWCYMDTVSMSNFVGVVSPSSPEIQYPTINSDIYGAFNMQPVPISATSALFGSNWMPYSVWTAASTNGILGIASRFNSSATPAVDPVTHTAFIPYGVHNGEEVLAAIDLTDITNPIDIASTTWLHPAADNGLSLLHDLIPYEGFLFFMHNNSFYKMNATTMTLTGGFVVNVPCNIGHSAPNGVSLKLVTYGQDIHGPLNAFILSSSTANATHAEFTACRVSHITGNQEWIYTVADDFAIEDITGGAESVVLLTGYHKKSQKQSTLVLNILNGASYGIIHRQYLAQGSNPLFLPTGVVKPPNGSSVPCGPAFVLEVDGSINAYCVTPFVAYNQSITVAWVSVIACYLTPAFDPVTSYVVCMEPDRLSAAEAATGDLVWMSTSAAYISGPQIVQDGNKSYVFVGDAESTLLGFEMALPSK